MCVSVYGQFENTGTLSSIMRTICECTCVSGVIGVHVCTREVLSGCKYSCPCARVFVHGTMGIQFTWIHMCVGGMMVHVTVCAPSGQ